jgi:1-acyl-sn-glycerol-3-phosphate acyltransferase
MSVESMWRPTSSCGAQCLPPGGRVGAAAVVRVAARLAAVAVVLAAAVPLVPVISIVRPAQHATIRLLARVLLAVLGVWHELRGRPPRRGLVVANHVSWLDIPVLLARMPVQLIAKHQVRRWPVIGWLAASVGTVFIDRSRPRTLPATIARIATALRHGPSVAVFPEATTWCGRARGSFRPAMFQAAIDAGAPIAPVGLRYRTLDGHHATVAAFLGEDTLIASLLRVARLPGMRVTVDVHPALYPGLGATRRTLSRAAHASVTCRSLDPAHSSVRRNRVGAR